MSRLDLRLSASILGCLLGALGVSSHARELSPKEPLRVTLVSLARQAASSASDPGEKLSVRRAWATDSRAQLCALILDADGRPVLDQGRFQLRRIQFQHQQGQWRVQRSDTSWLPPGGSLDTACPRPGNTVTPPTQAAKAPSSDINLALAEMDRQPPTAGLPGGRPANASRDATREAAHCESTSAASAVTDTVAAGWPTGQIGPAGRSHLFAAPDTTCPMGKHLVQNDKVRIGATRNGWTQVRYTHPITNVVTVGWLPRQKVVSNEAQVASATH